MKNFIYTVFIFLLIAGCKPGIPSDIIQPDKMALVLNDIHIVDGFITAIPNADSSRAVAASFYNGIYKKFGIDSALYNKSLNYYATNPKALDEIYKKVTAGLSKQKEVLVKADSLVKAKAAKKLKLKMKADSVKTADSLKKINAPIKAKLKADSLKKAIAIKKADSTKKVKAFIRIKKRRPDSAELKELLKKEKKVPDSAKLKTLLKKAKAKKVPDSGKFNEFLKKTKKNR